MYGFYLCGGFCVEGMDVVVYCCVVVVIEFCFGVDYCFWFLGVGGVVEIDQWLIVDFLVQYWKIGVNLFY